MNARTTETKVAAQVVSIAAPRWAVIRHLETGNVVAEHLVDSRDDATRLLDCYAELWPSHPLYVELRHVPIEGEDPVPERVATVLFAGATR